MADEERYVHVKYTVLIAYFLVIALVLLFPLIVFLPSSLSFGSGYSVGFAAIIIIVLLMVFATLFFLSKSKARELDNVRKLSREAVDKKEISADTKFLMGAFMLVIIILVISAFFMPIESIPGLVVLIAFVLLLIMGFRKYNK